MDEKYSTLISTGISMGVGCFVALTSVLLGSWIVFRTTRSIGRDGLFSVRDPKGDVFTVPDVDDMSPFPEDEKNPSETHVLGRTEQFLKNLDVLNHEEK